ncbi:MAG: alpha/beta fold hydrolase [Micrococcales bacterium]|nr:alpha/beta fold hydrolase [Micrococcales bacterium]
MTGGEVHGVELRGGRTAFRVDGPADAPALVLVHGLQIGQTLFDPLRRHLAPAFQVITYDQRDCGGSAYPPAGYGTDDLADDLAALVTALGHPRVHVLGTSFGGMVAQAFALRHPALLDRLVLGATSQAPFRPGRVTGPVADLLAALGTGDAGRAAALLARMAPATKAATAGAGDDGAAAARSAALVRRFAATRGFDTRGALGGVAAPVLVVHGRDDATVPVEDVLAMTAELPDADLLLLAGAGHAWENEVPARAAAHLTAFLRAEG